MITCSDVFGDEKLNYPLKYLNLKLKAMEVLSIFLLYHKWLGAQSEWKHYIDSLPVTYTVPAFCTEKEVSVMPEFLKSIVQGQEEDLQNCFDKAQKIFGLLCVKNSCCYLPSLTDIKWAWFTVNTRVVYMKNSYPNPILEDEDICALAPYLDLLNHSHTAQVEAGLSEDGEFYQIKTLVPYGPYEQVFINYGPHDNIKLYQEYGFVLPDNPHSSVPFILDELLAVMKVCDVIENAHARKDLFYEKQRIIVSHNYHKNLVMSSDGPSWNFEVAATILLMTADELSQWDVIYEDLTGISHRHLVQCCLRMLCQSKLDHFNSFMMNMEDIEDCTEAFACAKMLIKDCCLMLSNAEKSLQQGEIEAVANVTFNSG
ncbi:SET domain-containing protein 4-like [Macrobrachium nipponense]|uniref:SET domain-containing protein 4-like n=1 Tax=Macrobrachium nipponense TaxID=159736 RepID=UPI0030C80321